MDMEITPQSLLIAILAGIGIFSLMYFAARLALSDHEDDKAKKRGRP
jgi:xanthine/uracil/vitamin C permease (AzgA family)